jgi:translocation and assembly module TamB
MVKRLSFLLVLTVVALTAAFLALPVRGQNDEAQERSRFLAFVEEQLSAPGREIRINGIDGALSSNATIGEITIADEEGVWLRLTGAQIVWDRSALFRARLDIESLSAETIDWPRMPLPQDRPPSPEATPFALPDLPVEVNIDRLAIGEAVLGEPLFGLAATLTGEGSIALADGSLDSSFDVTRLDGPGGSLRLSAAYQERSTELTLDFQLEEPADGVVANLLNLEGRPPVDLSLTGNGPLDDLTVDLALVTDAGRVLGGGLRLQEAQGGRAFNADLSGPISALIAPAYRGFFGADSTLVANGTLPREGGFVLERLDLESGTLALQASAETAPDGFLTALDLNASFAAQTGASVLLPVPGEATRARAGALEVAYGGSNGDWQAILGLDGLTTEALGIETVRFDLTGQSANLANAASRSLTFQGSGQATGFSADDPALVEALGQQIALRLAGDWRAGSPVSLDGLRVDGDAFTLAADGQIETGVFDGQIVLDARTLAPFSGLADRDLGGAMQLVARGSLDALSGGFDLDLDGNGNALQIGDDIANRLLAGQTRITGGLKRDAEGTQARDLQVRNNQLALRLDGTLSSGAADLLLQAQLADLGDINPGASGAANLNATVEGEGGPFALSATLAVPNGQVYDQRLRDAAVTLSGLLEDEIFSGTLEGSGQFGNAPIDLTADLVAGPDERQITGLRLDTQGATLTGDVRQSVDTGLLDGAVVLNASNIRTLAFLALQDASGAVNADVTLLAAPDGQAIALAGTAQNAAFGETSLGAARFDVDVRDAFGEPDITGTINGERLRAGEIAVASLQATSQSSGAFTVAADGVTAPQLRAAGLSAAQLRANGAMPAM